MTFLLEKCKFEIVEYTSEVDYNRFLDNTNNKVKKQSLIIKQLILGVKCRSTSSPDMFIVAKKYSLCLKILKTYSLSLHTLMIHFYHSVALFAN